MARNYHSPYVIALVTAGTLAVVTPAVLGFEYYATPPAGRPFHPQEDSLKPTGFIGHGYRTAGALMILGGVLLYSSRKRFRSLGGVGKLRYFLEFHIPLSPAGPILAGFHTMFNIRGLVTVTFGHTWIWQ